MHPVVKPALRQAWRDLRYVQFGVTAAHAVVLGPVDTATGSLLSLFDGTRGLARLREEARAIGLPDGHVDALLERLAKAGLVDDVTGGGPAAAALRKRTGAYDRLRPDLASLSVVHPEPGGGAARLAARDAVRVQVRGAGRVGATVAAVLSAAGVGQVDVLDGGRVEPWDVAPGGVPAEAVGERRAVSAQQVVRRSAPGRARRAPRRSDGGPVEPPPLSLVIVAPRDGLAAYVPDPATAEDWLATGTPHLYAGVAEASGVVGPLVLPGGSACAGCLALRRADRDPVWPRMAAQWRTPRHRETGPGPCDLGLATTVAGMAASHALSFLDGELPASTGTRWEVSLPLLEWRSRRIEAHRDCPCGAAGQTEGERASGAGTTHDTMAGVAASTECQMADAARQLGIGGAHV
ncbi:TOMM precursor leader peptide-binding protein [Streptomyces marianii]|uniref:TOMM leader peptide-binding protein n=1 Tax=Streptomyces marianii TaxID=1817406 RepID=A0A5R9E1T3_9ACTN|nr:TOMM precursor leader peptide-binding protein [Streptomyces marianii]TLQ43888.1 TOMM precursor leader peptide-binding protein [Streptomyces marianii]